MFPLLRGSKKTVGLNREDAGNITKRILSRVPRCYTPVIRQVFPKHVPFTEHFPERDGLCDALMCDNINNKELIDLYARKYHWSFASLKQETWELIYQKGSVDFIIFCMEHDYSLSQKDHLHFMAKFDSRALYGSIANMVPSCRHLVKFGMLYGRIWMLDIALQLKDPRHAEFVFKYAKLGNVFQTRELHRIVVLNSTINVPSSILRSFLLHVAFLLSKFPRNKHTYAVQILFKTICKRTKAKLNRYDCFQLRQSLVDEKLRRYKHVIPMECCECGDADFHS